MAIDRDRMDERVVYCGARVITPSPHTRELTTALIPRAIFQSFQQSRSHVIRILLAGLPVINLLLLSWRNEIKGKLHSRQTRILRTHASSSHGTTAPVHAKNANCPKEYTEIIWMSSYLIINDLQDPSGLQEMSASGPMWCAYFRRDSQARWRTQAV